MKQGHISCKIYLLNNNDSILGAITQRNFVISLKEQIYSVNNNNLRQSTFLAYHIGNFFLVREV